MSDSWTGGVATNGRIGAVEYVLRDLTDAIRSGVFAVGSRLPSEAALSARYSVSRAVVREVLRACEARGITVTRNGKGTFVVSELATKSLTFGGYSAADLLEARPLIEVPAAGFAALRCSEEQIAAMLELVEAMEIEQDPAVWVGLDAALHLSIADASGNPVFAVVLSNIREALMSQSTLLNTQSSRRTGADLEHRAIISAIARGAALEAEDAMQFHLDQVKEAITSTIQPNTR